MSDRTLNLERWQVRELRRYVSGLPIKPSGDVTNLVRRGFLESVGYGTGAYRITALGRAALAKVTEKRGSGVHEARQALLGHVIIDVVHTIDGAAKDESLLIILDNGKAVEIKPGLLEPDHAWLIVTLHEGGDHAFGDEAYS